MNTPPLSENLNASRHREIMSGLAARHDVLLPLLRGSPIHYLDLPMYGNIGDLLIMQGTLRFLQKNDLPAARLAMYFNYSPRWAKPSDIIVFQGGGNFGDIYGPFQQFRERLVRTLTGNRIVILPQTIHFSDPVSFERCCQLFSRHPDLHICVRDAQSQAMARQMTPNVHLLPDMAHQLWPVERSAPATLPLLQLRRRDSERRLADVGTAGTFDWDDLIGKRWRFFLAQIAERSMYHATRWGVNQPLANIEARLWIAQAGRFVDRAVTLFSRHELVESDRLHAHILACLLGIPSRINDNSYGKNHNYIKTWTANSELVEMVESHSPSGAGTPSDR